MDNARSIRWPWRSWTLIALVLVGLTLVQACGKSGSSTGPTSGAALQVKLRRAGAALLPEGCSGGIFKISAPGQPTITGALQGGQITVSLPVGVTFLIVVEGITCPGIAGPLGGSATFTVPQGGGAVQIVINVSQVLGLSCSPSIILVGKTSTCTCTTQQAGPANITWTGVNASGKTATFSSNIPDDYTITCTINGIDTRSTTVTVQAPEAQPPPPPPTPTTGSVQVTNDAAPTCGFCTVDVTFSSPAIATITGLAGGQSALRSNIPPGNYTATPDCDSPIGFTIQAGQTTQVNFVGNCG
jgi:hypothetical protein